MDFTTLIAFGGALFGGALAFNTAWNERRSVAHLSFVAGMAILAVESVFSGLSWEAASVKEVLIWQRWRLVGTALLPGLWLLFSLSYGRGNYREFLQRWRWLLLAAFSLPLVVGIYFHENLFAASSPAANGSLLLNLGLSGMVLTGLFLVSSVVVLMNLERTYRASVGTMRWRIKYMILGLGVMFAVRGYTSSQALLFHVLDPRLQIVDCGALLVGCALIFRSSFRARHFDLDIYPSHSVLQSSLTVMLAGIYLLIIGLFAKVVAFLGGDQAFALEAFVVLVALVVLTVLLLSERMRQRTSQFVSRHFQRPQYDYRTVWRRFTEATASCVRQPELCQATVKSVTDIFQALSVTLWLADERKEKLILGASTFLSPARAELLQPDKTAMAVALQALRERREPVDIDATNESWAVTLRHCHPDEFRQGGNRVGVPLIVGGEILGLMILGDRVGAKSYSWQDYDLLKCIGDQVAAGLLDIQLSQKILQAKELEAFQTMSAFFVHDLKNTANTLNLMLQNLPVHFDDPAFRADALRGVANTVAHINQLISRLGSIRHELQIKPVAADLNEVVTTALAGWEEVAGIQLIKNLSPLPRLWLDSEQMFKVVTNLVFNAREAVLPSGQVRIETSQQAGWAVLTVADTGCGMSAEFLRRSLFRPFQTTKKNGLGIGMFQSKMIVEAHQGRIEVESEAGKGAVFRVFLPLPPPKP